MTQRLPFELTAGQRDVLDVMSAELGGDPPMNRMLQGEVGSGKTIVSVLAMLQMVDAGYQCALLAPTEVLAAQHARSIRDVLGPLAMAGQLGGDGRRHPRRAADGIDVAAAEAGGARRGRRRRSGHRHRHARAAAGRRGVRQLGMVVVDEQHRFGVEQRDRLRAKAIGGITPHLLVMTATPIPAPWR